ncbi:MAG: hypothetical protein U0Q11_20035 [Vicinamibacterales bacterium]
MKNAIVLTCLMFLLSRTSSAQQDRHDGNWWNTLSPSSQVEYVIGFCDGIELGKSWAQPTLTGPSGSAENREKLREFDAIEQRARERSSKYAEKVSFGQVADGLTEFYRDFRNRSIRVHWAVDVVLRQISGENVTSMVESLRRL